MEASILISFSAFYFSFSERLFIFTYMDRFRGHGGATDLLEGVLLAV